MSIFRKNDKLETKSQNETKYLLKKPAKGGLFMAYPEATSSGNHGLAFNGFAEDTTQNGLLASVTCRTMGA